MLNKNYVIYRHIRLDTNKTFYIGIGSHKRPYNTIQRSKWWKRVTNKADYEIDILKKDLTWEDAVELEIILISYYGRKDKNEGELVNMTDGGEGAKGNFGKLNGAFGKIPWNKNKEHSQETRSKISFSKKGNKNPCYGRIKEKHPMYGKIPTTCKKIIDNNTGIIYLSIKQAAEINGYSYSSLKSHLNGNTISNRFNNFTYYQEMKKDVKDFSNKNNNS